MEWQLSVLMQETHLKKSPPLKTLSLCPLMTNINGGGHNTWRSHQSPKYVLLVQHTIQGQPESTRLWEKHINNILQEIGFKSTTHERCIYQTKIKNYQVLFLRQVDDFAVASKDPQIAKAVIAQIWAKLQVLLNHLGVIAKLNDIDVLQTRSYIKISCQTYLGKALDGHKWQEREPGVDPIPMRNDSVYQAAIERAIPPLDPGKQKELHDAHFNYRQVIGKAIYAMTTSTSHNSLPTLQKSTIKQQDSLWIIWLLSRIEESHIGGKSYCSCSQQHRVIHVSHDLKSCIPFYIIQLQTSHIHLWMPTGEVTDLTDAPSRG